MAEVAKKRQSSEQKTIQAFLNRPVDDKGNTLGGLLCIIDQFILQKTKNPEQVRVRVRTEGRPGSPGSRSTPIPARAPSGPAMVLHTHQPSPRGARSPSRRGAGSSRPSPRPPRHTPSLGVAALDALRSHAPSGRHTKRWHRPQVTRDEINKFFRTYTGREEDLIGPNTEPSSLKKLLNSAGQLIDRNPLALENVITSKMINSFEGQESAILKSLDKNIKKQVAKFRSQIQGKQVQKEKPAPRAEKRNSGRWKKDEEAALEDLVKKQNPHSADDWEKIARLLGTGRTSGACQSHWRVMNEQYYSKTDPTHFKNTLSHREVDLDPPGNGTEPWNTAYGVVVVVDGAQKRCLSTRLGIADFATRYFGKDISNDHRLFLGEPDAWADVGKQTIRLYERSRVFLLILCLHDTRNGKPLFTPTSSAKNDFKELLAANQDLMQARQEQKPEGIKKWVMKNIDSTPPCKPFHTYRQRLDFPTKAAWAAFVDAEKKQEQEEAKKR